MEITFKNGVALYKVAAMSESATALLTFLCCQLTLAAKRKGQILQGICSVMFSFLPFHWLKFCFSYYSPRINSHNNGICSHFPHGIFVEFNV